MKFITKTDHFSILLQIGLPHEHTIVLCRIFTENTNKLKSKAKQLSLRCSIPKSINCIKENDIFIMDTETWQAQSNSVEKNQFTLSKEQIELMISGTFYLFLFYRKNVVYQRF